MTMTRVTVMAVAMAVMAVALTALAVMSLRRVDLGRGTLPALSVSAGKGG